jgi:hypothetical protein
MVEVGRRRRTVRWVGWMVAVVLVAGGCSTGPGRPSTRTGPEASPVSPEAGTTMASPPDATPACEALVMVTAAALEPVVAGDGAAATALDAMRAEWWRWAPPHLRDDVAAVERAVADHLRAMTELHEVAALEGRRPEEPAVLAELARGERSVGGAAHAISLWLDDHCFGHVP